MKLVIALSLLTLTACQTGAGAPSLFSLAGFGCSGMVASDADFRIQCVPPPSPVQTMAPCGGGMEPPTGSSAGFRVQCAPLQPPSESLAKQ